MLLLVGGAVPVAELLFVLLGKPEFCVRPMPLSELVLPGVP
ncbi:hypothetical protein BRPE64_DCDS07080 (plasmid) [Caballeronia insecticola]|uniref:Uncharacterized protein n=1 Tax=Caballeronia insecticola TaxID=758793 RepID=R4WSU0_9BURK|nr:hypothetical protein BRPE64_DCDS07080 [Caballeronia insecticola]